MVMIRFYIQAALIVSRFCLLPAVMKSDMKEKHMAPFQSALNAG
jgi:hypothetical protein